MKDLVKQKLQGLVYNIQYNIKDLDNAKELIIKYKKKYRKQLVKEFQKSKGEY